MSHFQIMLSQSKIVLMKLRKKRVTGLLSASILLRNINKFLFSSWMKWQTFLTWIMSNPKKIANNYKWRGGLFIEQRKYDWGVSPRRIIPPFVSARTSQFVQLTVFLYYIYIFYYVIVLHFRIIPPFVSVCPPQFVHRTAFWPKSSQSGNNQQSKCTKLKGFSSGQKLKWEIRKIFANIEQLW